MTTTSAVSSGTAALRPETDFRAALTAAALDYVNRGWALTWMDYGTKRPEHTAWNTPAEVITTAAAARRRWNGKAFNIGLVHGLGAVKTCSLDVDKVEHTRLALGEVGIDLDALRPGVPCIVGNPDNFRLEYRQPAGLDLPLVKLEWPAQDGAGKITIFELRAGANQDVLPPSRHPSGKPYEWLVPLPADPADHPEPPTALLELWLNWEAWEPALKAACPWLPAAPEPKPRPHRPADGANLDVIGQFNAAHDIRALLEANGYQARGKNRYLPPNSTSGVPSVRILDSGKVFSSNGSCLLNDGHAHDAFSVFTLLEHRGDVRAAVKAAADLLGIELKPSRKPADTQARPDEAEGAEAGDTLQDENLFSDYGNVVKLRNRLADRLAYTPGLDWLIYNPATGIWEPEPCSERVKRLALETLREAWSAVLYTAQREEDDLKKELKALDGDDPRAAMVQKKVKLATVHRDKVFQWVRQCETAYRIRSTLEIAEGYFWTAPAIWDANPHILVCANGVLDLATGTLLPHSPGHHATKTTGTAFKPGARHPAWDAVVTLLKSEGDRYTFIHQYCGSGLHGANPNERLVIAQGDGGTGKGTLLTAIHQALGAYAETIEVGSLLATDWRRQNKSAPREDLLKLRGARFVSPGIEPPKDSKLDDGSIKALTGNDAISARAPHAKNSITFTPVFKLIVQTNFPLRTEFDDPGMKRRVIVVPFNQKPDRPDPAVKDALIRDPEARAACLAWLYEGYRAWRNAGYALPESALATSATAEYWDDMNPFAQFARDVGLKFGKLERCPKPKLTGALKAWRDETGRFDASLKGFPGWLKSKGCFDQQITGGSRLWYGVGFAEASSQQSQESPPDSVNMAVDFQYSKSTDNFTVTAGDSGYSCYADSDNPAASPAHPADDGLSSQHPPVEPTAPRCSSCLHLAGTHCRLRDETIQAPAVGSCLKWEATL